MDIARVRELCSEAREADARGDLPTALAAAKAAVNLAAAVGEPHYGQGMALMTMAWIATQAALPEEAAAAYRKGIKIARQLAADDFEHAAVILTQALRLDLAEARTSAAGELAGELLAWYATALGADHLRVHQCRAELEAAGVVIQETGMRRGA